MKQIPLSKDLFAIVDDEDFEELSKHKWCFSGRYAIRVLPETRKCITMHRQLLGVDDERIVKHLNDQHLDNRKENLKIVTKSQSQAGNKKTKSDTSSVYKGVSWREDDLKWSALIIHNYKRIFLGRFDEERDAALAYNKAAQELYGEHARINEVI